tara:strand:- start:10650 stop:11351 length:702 start_codon:yes stop_codon:yes gene_type:complete
LQKVYFEDLGLVDYQKCWDYQEQLNQQNVQIKLRNRKNINSQEDTTHHLLFCEHPLVYTLGKSGSMDNLKLNANELEDISASFYKINRGGDITHHGPGQLVVYPIFDLEKFYTDIHRFLRELEESVIQLLLEYGIKAGRYDGYTGVWLDPDDELKARKICAMGIRCSRWVTMHGIALNVNNDLGYFNNIIPCGIEDKQVTSIAQELGSLVKMDEIKSVLLNKLSSVFGIEYIN